MYDYHVVLGIAAAVVGALSFIPYFRDVWRGTTKPHPFTYFAWGLVSAIAFLAQISAEGGPGAWVNGVVTLELWAVALVSLRWGEKGITALDWWCLGGALMGIILWQVTKNPLAAVVLVSMTDALAAAPTFRKSYSQPRQETALSYALGALRSLISIPALTVLSLTTVLYPATLALVDVALVAFLLIRRNQLKIT